MFQSLPGNSKMVSQTNETIDQTDDQFQSLPGNSKMVSRVNRSDGITRADLGFNPFQGILKW